MNEIFAFGEFNVKELLKHHFKQVKTIIVNSQKEKEKYNNYNIDIDINPKYIHKLIKKEDIYSLAIFYPYNMELNKDKIHILIYNLDDEGEMGTIIRTSVALDFKDIVFINTKSQLFSSKLIRSSVGAFFLSNIKKYSNEQEYFKEYPNANYYKFVKEDIFFVLDFASKIYKLSKKIKQ